MDRNPTTEDGGQPLRKEQPAIPSRAKSGITLPPKFSELRWEMGQKAKQEPKSPSPLLANLYLHWFEKQFTRSDGPGRWANAKLVRYANNFVVLAHYQSRRLIDWIEGSLAGGAAMELAPRCRSKLFAVLVPGQGGGSNRLCVDHWLGAEP